jgi:16S rRNA processing protein RimM
MTDTKDKVCIAKILTAHGVRGLVKLRCFLDNPTTISDYNPMESEDGRKFSVTLKNPIKEDWVASIDGITDRNIAEKLRHLELYVDRDRLPETDTDEYYIDDLIGCAAIDKDGAKIGDVIGFENYGAGDLLEIKPASGGKSYYLPMAEPYVGDIDLDKKTVTVEPAEEFMA